MGNKVTLNISIDGERIIEFDVYFSENESRLGIVKAKVLEIGAKGFIASENGKHTYYPSSRITCIQWDKDAEKI